MMLIARHVDNLTAVLNAAERLMNEVDGTLIAASAPSFDSLRAAVIHARQTAPMTCSRERRHEPAP